MDDLVQKLHTEKLKEHADAINDLHSSLMITMEAVLDIGKKIEELELKESTNE